MRCHFLVPYLMGLWPLCLNAITALGLQRSSGQPATLLKLGDSGLPIVFEQSGVTSNS
jgi:hypothetical protein